MHGFLTIIIQQNIQVYKINNEFLNCTKHLKSLIMGTIYIYIYITFYSNIYNFSIIF